MDETKGSQIAKDGFKNEKDIAEKFNNWKNDTEAKLWLEIMQYDINEIEYVKATVLHGYKSDLNVQIQIKLKKAIDTENIQVKLVSNKKGFNQIDKRNLSSYNKMWNIPENVYRLLQYFTGEKLPYKSGTKDKRRMYINEFDSAEQNNLLQWINKNKFLIVNDIIRGRGQFACEWVLVAQKEYNHTRWILKNINEVLQYYSGDAVISPKGSIKIGKITM